MPHVDRGKNGYNESQGTEIGLGFCFLHLLNSSEMTAAEN